MYTTYLTTDPNTPHTSPPHTLSHQHIPSLKENKQEQHKYHLPAPNKYHNRLSTICLMQIAHDLPLSPSNPIQLNVDGGANRSITNNSSLLINYRNINHITCRTRAHTMISNVRAWDTSPGLHQVENVFS
jgi:hypothetical protein